MLQNSSEFNNVGAGGLGGFGGLGGGIGAFGLFGLLGVDGLGGRRKDGDDGCRNELATLAAIANAKDTTVAEGRALGAAICDSEKTNLQQFYAAAVQSANLAQDIKDQATAFAIVADRRADELTTQAANNTAAILARINDVENQGLRDRLAEAHRHSDGKDISIAINNSNAQAQAQFQAQNNALDRKFDAIFNSFNALNKNTQDIINFGTMAASGNQANQQTTIK